MKNIFKKIVIGSLITSAVLSILAILFDIDSELGANILLSTMIISPFSMAGLCCSSLYEKKNLKWLSIVGITISVVSCLYYIGQIWGIFDVCLLFCEDDNNFGWEIFLTTTLLPACLSQICLLLSYNCETEPAKKVQKVTAILSTIITILILDGIWTQLIEYNEFLGKIVIIMVILVTVGTILTRILSRPSKKIDIVKDIIDYNVMDDINNDELTCPNCNKVINPEWKFCPNCNNKLIKEPQKCPNCNNEVKEEWKFCPNCNTSLEQKEKQSE